MASKYVSTEYVRVPDDTGTVSVPSIVEIDFGIKGLKPVRVDFAAIPVENRGVFWGNGIRNWARDAQGPNDGKQGQRIAARLEKLIADGGLPGTAGSPIDPVVAIVARVAVARHLAKAADAAKWRTEAEVLKALGNDVGSKLLAAVSALARIPLPA